ncbi:MAG: hypothetical protein JRJ86_11330 [Deltaproteobacteria bacterium]|nr:hypothetical protein [Deltaproteobacteria bacterium]MBW2118058.1 hypothetical protein [Deltaproteobacteria bacterium]MBW2345517.1 hypothetical protein [Deltaproteobacteria bacterium]
MKTLSTSILDDAVFFDYLFKFEDGTEKEIRIHLDPVTLKYLPKQPLTGDEWTRLENNQCESCPIDPKTHPHCPLALAIEDLVSVFKEKFSYESAEITVYTNERTYFKDTTMQKGLSSIMGILMVSSGCPVMAKLRPMVRLHLPFSSILETTFRTTSTYLLGQFFLKKKGKISDFTFEGLLEIYKNVNMVNRSMAERIRSAAGKDASVNALIILDMFALDIPLSIEEQIEDIEPFFRPYFEE